MAQNVDIKMSQDKKACYATDIACHIFDVTVQNVFIVTRNKMSKEIMTYFIYSCA